jgi:tetratricopeptide (TPR) repeat protein
MRRLLLLFICLLAFASPVMAQSNPDEQSKELYAKGKVFFDKEEYQKALALFQEAYQLSKNPGLLPNIGQCHKELGQNTEAALAFQSFLRSSPDSPYFAEVQALFKEVEAFLPKETKPVEPPPTATPPAWKSYKAPILLLGVGFAAGAGALGLRVRLDNAQGEEVGAAPFVARASLAITADVSLLASGASFLLIRHKIKTKAKMDEQKP